MDAVVIERWLVVVTAATNTPHGVGVVLPLQPPPYLEHLPIRFERVGNGLATAKRGDPCSNDRMGIADRSTDLAPARFSAIVG